MITDWCEKCEKPFVLDGCMCKRSRTKTESELIEELGIYKELNKDKAREIAELKKRVKELEGK